MLVKGTAACGETASFTGDPVEPTAINPHTPRSPASIRHPPNKIQISFSRVFRIKDVNAIGPEIGFLVFAAGKMMGCFHNLGSLCCWRDKVKIRWEMLLSSSAQAARTWPQIHPGRVFQHTKEKAGGALVMFFSLFTVSVIIKSQIERV